MGGTITSVAGIATLSSVEPAAQSPQTLQCHADRVDASREGWKLIWDFFGRYLS